MPAGEPEVTQIEAIREVAAAIENLAEATQRVAQAIDDLPIDKDKK